jgi:hypothetical protein
MNETEWLMATEPGPMLRFLQHRGSPRKLRLFAFACCRRIWDLLPDGACREVVLVAEQYADGQASRQDLVEARRAARSVIATKAATRVVAEVASITYRNAFTAAQGAANLAAVLTVPLSTSQTLYHLWVKVLLGEKQHHPSLLRDIFGNPFRPPHDLDTDWLTWNDGTVKRLAQAAYEERALPEGTLEVARLAVLADALTDAGCDDADLLDHLRGPGPHVRGCFVVDLLTGRE